MTGILFTASGQQWQLPTLPEWEILRTDGHSCDSFLLRFPFTPGEEAALRTATRVTLSYDGQVRLTGIVDEVRVALDGDGCTATIEGRSLLGLLLDNAVQAVEFQRATFDDILSWFVYPYGIPRVTAPAMPALTRFRVDSGTSCFAALAGFCLHSANLTPRLLADGTLTLLPCEDRYSLAAGAAVEQAVWRRVRYGVASEVQTPGGGAAQNAAFLALGGQARKIAAKPATYLRAGYRTAQQELEAAAADFDTLELTLPGAFLAEPGATVSVALDALGLSGSFTVREVRSRADADGMTCRLTLAAPLG